MGVIQEGFRRDASDVEASPTKCAAFFDASNLDIVVSPLQLTAPGTKQEA